MPAPVAPSALALLAIANPTYDPPFSLRRDGQGGRGSFGSVEPDSGWPAGVMAAFGEFETAMAGRVAASRRPKCPSRWPRCRGQRTAVILRAWPSGYPLRDILEHFDEYARGKGGLQKDAIRDLGLDVYEAAAMSWGGGYDPATEELTQGPFTLVIPSALEAAERARRRNRGSRTPRMCTRPRAPSAPAQHRRAHRSLPPQLTGHEVRLRGGLGQADQAGPPPEVVR
jgi:hypothetical protein